MASRDRVEAGHHATGSNAGNPSASRPSPPPSRTGIPRTPSDETASLHSVRKRASFFGRSNSDASSMRRGVASSHAAKSSFSGIRVEGDVIRPTTAASGEMRRRKTDPLQSIRDSIFGGKKKGAADGSSSRPGSRGTETLPHDLTPLPSSFSSEEEYYRHLKKHSISPPFNFQHVTHTARNQLPQLETVDEKDLPGRFWSVAAYQRPRRRVHGIKVDDLETKHRQMGLIKEDPEPSLAFSPPVSPPVSPPPTLTIPHPSTYNDLRLISPISPVSPLDSHLPDVIPQQPEQLQSTPELARSSSKSSNGSKSRSGRHPKRHSSLGVLNQHFQPPRQQQAVSGTALHVRSQESFYDSNSSSEGETRKKSPKRKAEPSPSQVPELNASMPPKFSADYDVAFRARQPLPLLPPQTAAGSSAPSDRLQFPRGTPASMLSPTLPLAKPLSPESKRSSRSSRSAAKRFPATSQSLADQQNPSMFSVSDVSWEDSIDLAYEEEAEATCDFTWSGRNPAQRSVAQRSDGKRDSAATVSQTGSPNLSNASELAVSLHANSSTDTVAERKPGDHKRGTSVGHRGFLAARKNSTPDLLSKAKDPPAPLSFSQGSTQVSVLSPVFSVADEEAQKTPPTPAELHYPHIERVSNDYLSDPESYRNSNSSKHRKSSSYGSYGSYDSAGTRTGPPTSNPNTTRWSIASSGSVPDLMHSRPKSKSSLSRSVVAQPLETLPQSPPGSGEETQFRDIPRSDPEPARNMYVVRRSGDSTDRVVQAAGRAVQRGRPGSYVRYSQHLGPQPPPPPPLPREGVRESWVTGPDWI